MHQDAPELMCWGGDAAESSAWAPQSWGLSKEVGNCSDQCNAKCIYVIHKSFSLANNGLHFFTFSWWVSAEKRSTGFDPVIRWTLCWVEGAQAFFIFLYLDAKGELATGWNINLLQCCLSQISSRFEALEESDREMATDRVTIKN